MLTDRSYGWLPALALAACLAVPTGARAQAPASPPTTAPAPPGAAPVRGLERLSPEERTQAERNLQRWKGMTPEQRQGDRKSVV